MVDVVIIGCGAVGRGMGWYHAKQLVENRIPGAKLTHVVDPYFAGAGKDSEQGTELASWLAKHSVAFLASVGELPKAENKVLALVAGRTPDNAAIVRELVEGSHCTHIFLEKPGATSWQLLEELSTFMNEKGAKVSVGLGYVRGSCGYVNSALELAKKTPGSSLNLTVSNDVPPGELGECFNRNPEGIIKNMTIHEIALLADRFGATADSVEVSFDREESVFMEAGGKSDFSKVKFTVKTKDGMSITLRADRCSGSFCEASVSVGGVVQEKFSFPDAALLEQVKVLEAANPNCLGYLLLQDEIYVRLKTDCVNHMLADKPGTPEGLVSLPIGVEALKLAEKIVKLAAEPAAA